jgi:FlaA1/EpsC-like NDP-sugar epimerase
MGSLVVGGILIIVLVQVVLKALEFFRASRYQWSRQVMLITGGSQGIGKCVVEQAAAKGCRQIFILDIIEPTFKLNDSSDIAF